jgi:hypothetical protein
VFVFIHKSFRGCVYFIVFTLTSCAGYNKQSDLQTAIQYPIPPKGRGAFPVQPGTVKPAVFDFTAENEHITGNKTRPLSPSPSIGYNQIKLLAS